MNPRRVADTFRPGHALRGKISRGRAIACGVICVFSIGLLGLFQTRYLECFKVVSDSMSPTLKVGDMLLKIRTTHFEREEIVVFDEPDQPGVTVVKRLVGLPGDKIVVKKGHLWVNGVANRDYEFYDPDLPLPPDDNYVLGKDEFFVAGDNRVDSRDSRFFGPVPRKYLLGKMLFRYYMVKDSDKS